MKSIFVLFFLSFTVSAEACFIIIGKKNGRVLVGNNEDWDKSDSKFWMEDPGRKDKYKTLFFGFKGEFSTAQGGFNEKGLFFDATAVPKLTMEDSVKEGKEKAIHPIFKNILKQCATVEEASRILSGYYVPFIKKVQIILADASGAYLVMNVNGIVERGVVDNDYKVITNFHVRASQHFCYRYDSAVARLEKKFENTPEEIAGILSLNHQEFPGATVYSNVYDLTSASVRIYYNHQFDKSITADFKDPSGKTIYLEEQFSRRMIHELIDIHKKKGIASAITFFKQELNDPKSRYQCDDEQLSDLTTRMLNQYHFQDGLVAARENTKLFPESDRAEEQLGKALMYNGMIEEGKAAYRRALAINPSNRWANAVLKQFEHHSTGTTHLRLKGYGDATFVMVVGEFNEWQMMQNICFKNEANIWECNLTLPPGRYPYRFLVNGKWVDDPENPPSKEIERRFFVSELNVP